MSNAESKCTQRQKAFWVLGWHENRPEPAVRPRNVGLDAAAQPGAVPAFCLARHKPRLRDAAVPTKLFAKRPQRDLGARGQPIKILGKGIIVEPDREDRVRPIAGHAQPSSSLRNDPKWRSNSSGLRRCSP